MRNEKKIWARGVKLATVLACVAVFVGAMGCAAQTDGTTPKKSGNGCLSLLQLFS